MTVGNNLVYQDLSSLSNLRHAGVYQIPMSLRPGYEATTATRAATGPISDES